MLSIAEFGDRTLGPLEVEPLHTSKLIMHWIAECRDPREPRAAANSTMTANTMIRGDKLVAEWIELGIGLPPAAD